MNPQKSSEKRHLRRKCHIRKTVSGTAERPRLTVSRSNKHISAQIVDDDQGKTLVAATTTSKACKAQIGKSWNVQAAAFLGEELAKKALGAGIKKVVFDRNGFLYHGRVKALADAARKAGLDF